VAGPSSAVHRLVVVGADAAGMSAAHQALRTARAAGADLHVVALERTAHTSYSACGIPYWVAGDVEDGDRLVARTAQQHRDAGVDLRLGVEAVALDLAARTVTGVDVATGARTTWEYDDVLLATGAAPVVPPWALDEDGRPVPGVRAVKDLDDGAAWVAMLDAAPRRGVVVGGGYIGLEMAEAFARKGLATTLVTRREVMGTLDPDMGARVREAVERAGVTVRVGEDVGSLEVGPDGRVACVSAVPTGGGPAGSGSGPAAGERFEGDVVALGLGARPRSELALAAGLAVGDLGGVLTDDRQRALGRDGAVLPGAWAAGDCCEHVERHGGLRVYVPLGTHANKMGRVAGENIGRSAAGAGTGGAAGAEDRAPARFGGVLGTAVTRFAANGVHVEIGRTGPTTQQALGSGRDVASLVTESTTASGYMPEAAPIAVKVLAEKGSRRLLGVQVVGGPGSAKRVDTAAAAIWLHASVDDVAGMDLSYAPPFSPVYDPVQIACRRLAERM
jgi:NADPH-dependent 2,4-dienoyl-CoA reductase/sulfur reductase-like enzyme